VVALRLNEGRALDDMKNLKQKASVALLAVCGALTGFVAHYVVDG
jgi:hypothetical protein